MKNKIIMIAVVLFTIVISCSKEDKKRPAKAKPYPARFNSHRAVRVSGTNDVWGNYDLKINYDKNNFIDYSPRRNQEGDTVGGLFVDRTTASTTVTFSASEKVHSISADSIERLDLVLKNKYGEGNYNLEDSIPTNSRSRLSVGVDYFGDGRIARQTESYYIPREDVGISGVNFDNSYIIKRRVTNIYEYNEAGLVVIDRIYDDEFYDDKDPKLFRRKALKYEVTYDKNRIVSFTKYVVNSGNSYSREETYHYNYSNSRLVSITGDKSYHKVFEYDGNSTLKIIEGERVMTCTVTSFGYPTTLKDRRGNTMNVEYELGHGQLDVFVSFEDKLYGNPYVR